MAWPSGLAGLWRHAPCAMALYALVHVMLSYLLDLCRKVRLMSRVFTSVSGNSTALLRVRVCVCIKEGMTRPSQLCRSVMALAVVVCIMFFLGLLLMYRIREWHPRRHVDSSLMPTDGLVDVDVVADVYDETEQNERARTERELSILMQKRISYLQNPANCTSAKKLLCSFVKNQCGFACLIHQVVFCFIMSYATERTVVIDAAGWLYTSEGWENAFLPVTKCTIARTKRKYRL